NAINAVYATLTPEEIAFEQERQALLYHVPELRPAIGVELERGIDMIASLLAERTGRSVDDFEIRVAAGALAGAGVAVSLEMSGGTVSKAGIALTGVGAANIKATGAESVLMGANLNQGTIDQAAREAANSCEPKSDHRGSAEYKREIVRVFTVRALSQAAGLRAA
ncbi:MAG: hypothetical protein KY393_06695, partial [Actinobacteria bacterium]|nr:hypothetical protein [Actinomycetota bacterium]